MYKMSVKLSAYICALLVDDAFAGHLVLLEERIPQTMTVVRRVQACPSVKMQYDMYRDWKGASAKFRTGGGAAAASWPIHILVRKDLSLTCYERSRTASACGLDRPCTPT